MEREKQKEISKPDHCLLNSKTYQNGSSEICGIESQASSSRQNISEDVYNTRNGQPDESFLMKVEK